MSEPTIPPPSDDAIALAANLARTACGSELIDPHEAYDECQRFAELMRVAAVFIREHNRRCRAAESERDAALAENARLRANLAITEQHYAELADFVERTPAEEQDRELVRLQKALRKEMKS